MWRCRETKSLRMKRTALLERVQQKCSVNMWRALMLWRCRGWFSRRLPAEGPCCYRGGLVIGLKLITACPCGFKKPFPGDEWAFSVTMENDPEVDDNLELLRSPTETLSTMHGITYLCPPGNQSDITPFLKDLGLRQWYGVGLHGNLLHWGITKTHTHI